MKILHVVPYFAPAWSYGGPPRAVFEIAKRQIKLGHEVTVLTTDAFEKNKRLISGWDLIDRVKIFRVKNISNFLMDKFHFCTPAIWESKIKISDFDIIHLHETRTFLNLWILVNKRKNQKVLFSPWGTIPYNENSALLKKIYDFLFLGFLRSKIDLGLAQNIHEKEILQKSGLAKETKIWPLGVDLGFFKKLPNQKQAKEKFKIKPNEFVFLYLGRFSPLKGIEVILKEFSKLKSRARLLLVGREDGLNIKRIIQDKNLEKYVVVSKPLYDKDRLWAYAACDAFVYKPTVYEETSTACLEALTCGKPVIVSKEAAIPYLGKKDGVFESMAEVMTIKNLKISNEKFKNYFDFSKIVQKLDILI